MGNELSQSFNDGAEAENSPRPALQGGQEIVYKGGNEGDKTITISDENSVESITFKNDLKGPVEIDLQGNDVSTQNITSINFYVETDQENVVASAAYYPGTNTLRFATDHTIVGEIDLPVNLSPEDVDNLNIYSRDESGNISPIELKADGKGNYYAAINSEGNAISDNTPAPVLKADAPGLN